MRPSCATFSLTITRSMCRISGSCSRASPSPWDCATNYPAWWMSAIRWNSRPCSPGRPKRRCFPTPRSTSREPPLGDFSSQEIENLLLGDLAAMLLERCDAGKRPLLPLGMENRDDGCLHHFGMRHDGIFEVDARYPFAAALHEILGAIHDLHVAFRIDGRDIAGTEPSFGERFVATWIVVVSADNPWAAGL